MTEPNEEEGRQEESEEEPPPSGMARSIQSLFAQVTVSARTDGEESHPDAESADPSEEPTARELRDRFTTFLARYIRAAPDARAELEEAIHTNAALLREGPEIHAVADAVVSLTLRGVEEGDVSPATELAAALLDGGVAEHLAARLGNDRNPEVRETLTEVARVHPERLAPALAGALADAPDRGVRRALVDALQKLGAPGRSAVLELLDDPRWFAVRNGIALLSELEDPEVVSSLVVPLAHEDPRVRKAAVLALAQIGGEEAGMLLLGMLEDADGDVRSAAVMGVGTLRVEKAQRTLQNLLEEDDREEVQIQLLKALGQLGDPGAVSLIERRAVGSMFSRPARPIRIAAYRALHAIGTPHARKLLEAALADKDAGVRESVEGMMTQSGGR